MIRIILSGTLLICLSLGLVFSEPDGRQGGNSQAPLQTPDPIKLDIKEFRLANGMKVLVLERHASPTIAVNLVFRVGSVNERPGITGISHIIEHMLFKGSETIGTKDYQKEKLILAEIDEIMEKLIALKNTRAQKPPENPAAEDPEIKSLETKLEELMEIHRSYRIPDEFSMIYRRHGSRGLNAYTSKEITSYHCELPANKLELWAWLESDRFSHPVWRDFYQEKDVIMEERRMRSEVNPKGFLYEQFNAVAYIAHPLRWPTIGWMSDIQSITKKQLNEYFHQYYAPNNAIAVIVGDVEAMAVFSLMRRYFEPIPASPKPPPVVTTVEPAQSGERRVSVEFDAQPLMYLGYHTTTVGHPDDYTLDVVSELLSGGRTSRLYQNLVIKKGLCLSIKTYNDTGKYPGLFVISAVPRHPHTTQEVEEALYQELERLSQEPVSEPELTKAKKRLEADFLRNLNSNAGLARMMGYYEAIGTYKYLYTITEKRWAVTADDIKKVAVRYFGKENRTVATLVSKSRK